MKNYRFLAKFIDYGETWVEAESEDKAREIAELRAQRGELDMLQTPTDIPFELELDEIEE